MSAVPYERIVQWLAGPVSALVAYGATSLVHATISKATALTVATFVLTTLAGLAAHWKWLTNVAKWWEHVNASTSTGPPPSDPHQPLFGAGAAPGGPILATSQDVADGGPVGPVEGGEDGPDPNDGPPKTRKPDLPVVGGQS